MTANQCRQSSCCLYGCAVKAPLPLGWQQANPGGSAHCTGAWAPLQRHHSPMAASEQSKRADWRLLHTTSPLHEPYLPLHRAATRSQPAFQPPGPCTEMHTSISPPLGPMDHLPGCGEITACPLAPLGHALSCGQVSALFLSQALNGGQVSACLPAL